MRRIGVLVVVAACSACAALAGVDDYHAVDCADPQCTTTESDTGLAENALPESDTMNAPDTSTEPPIDTSPVCTPIAETAVAIGSWSIDATEVTNAQYAKFLAAKGTDTSGQPSYCSWNTSFTPTAGWPAPLEQCNHPVVRVDWCDAYAYCQWAGKRLCGNPSGGAGAFTGFINIAASQWYAACSRATGAKYIYGATYIAGACVDDAFDGKPGGDATDVKRRVGAATNCHGATAPYNAIFDMNGNVAEWEDSCNSTEGTGDDCHVRGGSYSSGWDKCDCDEGATKKRAQTADDLGFRCCSL